MKSNKFITGSEALEKAGEELSQMRPYDDPLFMPWEKAHLGQPVPVRTVFGEESYWLVPVVLQKRTIGFVRVLSDGKVAAMGTFYQDPNNLDVSPSVVTGISAEEVLEKTRSLVRSDQGEAAARPVFVHDGPQGREAWLVEVKVNNKPTRWIFVTPSFTYVRPAGSIHDNTLEG